MIGNVAGWLDRRDTARTRSRPSMPGITRSCRITVGLTVLATSTASAESEQIVELDVWLVEQRAPHGLADHRLVVDEEDHESGVGPAQGRELHRGWRSWRRSWRSLSRTVRRDQRSIKPRRRSRPKRQDLDGGAELGGGLRHAVDRAGGAVLGDGVSGPGRAAPSGPCAPSLPMPVSSTPTASPCQPLADAVEEHVDRGR